MLLAVWAASARLRRRETLIGYWIVSDNPPAIERIASTGYDYLCLDLQHGLIDYPAALSGLMAIRAGGSDGVNHGSSKPSGEVLTGTRIDKPGRVKSPYPPYNELDVAGLPSGSLAMDPTTQRVFRVP